MNRVNLLAIVLMTTFMAGCATPRFAVPAGRVAASNTPPTAVTDAEGTGMSAGEQAAQEESTLEAASKPQIERLQSPARVVELPEKPDYSDQFKNNDSLTVAAEGLPLREFLSQVFGELLKINYVVAPTVQNLEQPVTLNAQGKLSSRRLFTLSRDVLTSLGLSITAKDGVYFISPAEGAGASSLPLGFGRDAKDVPDVPGRILQVVPLRYGNNTALERLAGQLAEVTTQPDSRQGALFVTGTRPAILKALDLIRLLDQPTVRSSRLGIINLTYVSSREFTEQVSQLLDNEGVRTGIGRADVVDIAFVPLEQLGAVAVFANTAELLDRVEFWAAQIDRPNRGPSLRYFIYTPRYARASDLGESLAPLIGGPAAAIGNLSRDTRSAIGSGTAASTQITQENVMRRDAGAASGGSGTGPTAIQGQEITLSVDQRSNSLIFFTTGLRYEALLPMIRRLDIPPKQILLEATIAEVTLTGEFAYGVEFAFSDPASRTSGSTTLGLPGGGLTLNYVSSITDAVRLRLRGGDSRVNILSNPMLLVRDGVKASINVGNDIPTVGATATDPLLNDRAITTVLYRKTGLTLDITPTINAQGLVVMQISQQISNTVDGASSVAGAPIFFDRQVTTEVAAKSGQSIMLAGLISESGSTSSSNIPVLSRVPLIGAAFRSDSKKREKTELVLLITPKVIDSPDQWDEVRGNLENALQFLQLEPQKTTIKPPAPSTVSAEPPRPSDPR